MDYTFKSYTQEYISCSTLRPCLWKFNCVSGTILGHVGFKFKSGAKCKKEIPLQNEMHKVLQWPQKKRIESFPKSLHELSLTSKGDFYQLKLRGRTSSGNTVTGENMLRNTSLTRRHMVRSGKDELVGRTEPDHDRHRRSGRLRRQGNTSSGNQAAMRQQPRILGSRATRSIF